MTDEKQNGKDADKRKKIVIVLIVLVGAFLAWQVSGMFSSGQGEMVASPSAKAAAKTPTANTMDAMPSKELAPAPQQAQVAKPLPMSEREMELLKLQQETQAKYVTTMNELQMLKLSLEIAETNKDIMAARLDTVKSQKGIVDLLTPEKKSEDADIRDRILGQAQSLDQMQQLPQPRLQQVSNQPQQPGAVPQQQPGMQTMPQIPAQEEEVIIPYTVISVSKIENRWNAVVGVQGVLYSVHVGDVIPVDGSKVKSISSGGIILEKKDKERKISLVPII
jgi:hypothetical protein